MLSFFNINAFSFDDIHFSNFYLSVMLSVSYLRKHFLAKVYYYAFFKEFYSFSPNIQSYDPFGVHSLYMV